MSDPFGDTYRHIFIECFIMIIVILMHLIFYSKLNRYVHFA